MHRTTADQLFGLARKSHKLLVRRISHEVFRLLNQLPRFLTAAKLLVAHRHEKQIRRLRIDFLAQAVILGKNLQGLFKFADPVITEAERVQQPGFMADLTNSLGRSERPLVNLKLMTRNREYAPTQVVKILSRLKVAA